MKEIKVKLSIKCLYAAAAVQVLSFLYSIATAIKYLAPVSSQSLAPELSQFSYISLFGMSAVYTAAFVGCVLYVVQELKKDQPWAWFWAIVVFLFAIPSFALPFAVIGLLSLLDKRVRSEYLPKLDIQF